MKIPVSDFSYYDLGEIADMAITFYGDGKTDTVRKANAKDIENF